MMYVATSPQQGTDGAFYSENIADSAVLTDDEIASGSWLDDSQLAPGHYWVIADADPDYDVCLQDDLTINPLCADGNSNIESVTIPRPTTRYKASVSSVFAKIQSSTRL